MNEEQFIGFGLQDTPDDHRDFELGAIIDLPDLKELPKKFSFTPLVIKDQLDTDLCSAFATDSASELQEGRVLEPMWTFAVSKKISGDPDKWGQNIRDALKSHVKYGALLAVDSPFILETADKDKIRYIENWPDLFQKAIRQRKKSFFKVTGPYDHYDNIRASIWKFRDKKQAVVTGIKWHWASKEVVLTGTPEFGFGHLVAEIGWDERGIKIQNSAGLKAGEGGCHYMPREEVNYYVAKYGAYMFVDLEPEDAKYYLDNGIKITDNWIVALWKALKSLLAGPGRS
mgnify:CR=1 FL=1